MEKEQIGILVNNKKVYITHEEMVEHIIPNQFEFTWNWIVTNFSGLEYEKELTKEELYEELVDAYINIMDALL